MCSLELRSRLEELQLQNEANQRRMEEKYQAYYAQQHTQHDNLVRHVNELLHVLRGRNLNALSHPGHSHHFSAQSSYQYHPYPRALIGPGVVHFSLRFTANPLANPVQFSPLVNTSTPLLWQLHLIAMASPAASIISITQSLHHRFHIHNRQLHSHLHNSSITYPN